MRAQLGRTVLTAVFTAMASHGAYAESGTVSVRIGLGCIEVPASYRVVDKRTSVIDQSYGYILAPNRPQVEWSFGMSELHPLCHHECKTIWRRKEKLGGNERDVGLLAEGNGERMFFVVDEWISFRVNAADDAALAYLRQVVSGYQRREHPEQCRPRERP